MRPCVDGLLPGGIRLHAVLPPLLAGGAHVSLRLALRVLEAVVASRAAFVVSGAYLHAQEITDRTLIEYEIKGLSAIAELLPRPAEVKEPYVAMSDHTPERQAPSVLAMTYWQNASPGVDELLGELADLFLACRDAFHEITDRYHWQPRRGSGAFIDAAALPPRPRGPADHGKHWAQADQ